MSSKPRPFQKHPIASAVMFGIITLFVQWYFNPKEGRQIAGVLNYLIDESGVRSIIISVLLGLVSHIVLSLQRLMHEAWEVKDFIHDASLDAKMANLAKRTAELTTKVDEFRDAALLTTAPLSGQSKPFHDALTRIMNEKDAPVRWLAAKFVARKLAGDFDSFHDDHGKLTYTDKNGIDGLLGFLIPETKKKVYFNFPYTPEEWVTNVGYFRQFCDSCTCSREHDACPIISGVLDSSLQLPNHLGHLNRSSAIEKRRFVINPREADWSDTCYVRVLALCSELAQVETIFSNHPERSNAPQNSTIYDTNLLDDVLIKAKLSRKPAKRVSSSFAKKAKVTLVLNSDEAAKPFRLAEESPMRPPESWEVARDWALTKISEIRGGRWAQP